MPRSAVLAMTHAVADGTGYRVEVLAAARGTSMERMLTAPAQLPDRGWLLVPMDREPAPVRSGSGQVCDALMSKAVPSVRYEAPG